MKQKKAQNTWEEHEQTQTRHRDRVVNDPRLNPDEKASALRIKDFGLRNTARNKAKAIARVELLEKMVKDNKVLPNVANIGAVATGGFAAYNAGKAIAAKYRTTEKGHARAVEKASKQYEKVKNSVKNTPFMSLFKEQITLYKKQHPNTKLSDKEILNNLR